MQQFFSPMNEYLYPVCLISVNFAFDFKTHLIYKNS